MSHYTVLVVTRDGQSVDDALAPFDENRDDEFVVDESGRETDDGTFEYWYDEQPDGRRGYWTNSRAKWDWWTVGGRWSGQLILKPDAELSEETEKDRYRTAEAIRLEAASLRADDLDRKLAERMRDRLRCNTGLVRELDLEAMREEGRKHAREALDALDAAVAAHGPLPSHEWRDLFRTEDPDVRKQAEAARDAYWQHPTAKMLSERREGRAVLGIFGRLDFEDLDWIAKDRDGWVEGQGALVVVGHSLLTHNGLWMEQGQMGWFGMDDSTAESQINYAEAAMAYLANLDPADRLTLVDCHI